MASVTGVERVGAWYPQALDGASAHSREGERLGVVVGGSLSKGLVIKLDHLQPIEDLAVGRYVVVRGDQKRFFCMITDILLDAPNPSIQNDPPDINDPFLRAVYTGTAAYGKIHASLMLAIDDSETRPTPKPVKTIPGHFMIVNNATVEDVNAVFGLEDDTHFNVGAPLELEQTQINLDLKRLVERSVGVFGKSGTGKSFLTRMLLAGVIAKNRAVNLIFDMHNDYGWQGTSETDKRVQGLKQLFPARVSIASLDRESSMRRGSNPDFDVQIGYSDIHPEDISSLRATMDLSDAMIDAAYALHKLWREQWVERLLKITAEDIEEIESKTPTRSGTLAALQRRLQRFERWEFLVPHATENSVDQILQRLNNNVSVVLEFGRYGNSLEAYMLVANYITRRIHEDYVKRMEQALGDPAMEPLQLLITIEEAHKFLDPKVASQTTFGVIARELRKYKVTLFIVDQRPSQIDEEVMSQIGTRMTALLDNERDIAAVLTGISGASGLREVLARLDTKQQAIIMGHAVPMPVVVKTRMYDEAFYNAVKNEIAGGRSAGGDGSGGGGGSVRDKLGGGSKPRQIR